MQKKKEIKEIYIIIISLFLLFTNGCTNTKETFQMQEYIVTTPPGYNCLFLSANENNYTNINCRPNLGFNIEIDFGYEIEVDANLRLAKITNKDFHKNVIMLRSKELQANCSKHFGLDYYNYICNHEIKNNSVITLGIGNIINESYIRWLETRLIIYNNQNFNYTNILFDFINQGLEIN